MNDKIDKKKYLIKNTIIFAIGNFATKFISFLLIPLYTGFLTTTEYGVVDLLYTVGSFLLPLFTLNIAEAVLRFSVDKKNNNTEIISVATTFILIAVLLELLTIPIVNVFDNYKDYSFLFYLYISTLTISQVYLVTLKGKEKLKLYSFGNFIYSASISIFSIIFLVNKGMGIKGYFLAYIISNIIITLYSFIANTIFIDLKKFKFNKRLAREMIKYSVVLIPTSFIWWIMNSSDRIMVTSIVNSDANGIYAISYKIPTIVTTIISIFNQAWFFSAVRFKDDKDHEKYTNKIFCSLLNIAVIIAICVLIILKPYSQYYIDKNFYESWLYVPILLIGAVFQSLSTFIATSYSVEKDNKGMLLSGVLGAILNIVLNFALIPCIGAMGAAIATCVSYIIVYLYRALDTRKFVKIRICSKKCIINYVILLASSMVVYMESKLYYLALFILLIIQIYNSKDTILQLIKKRKEK